jgi:DNA (cytosine-5)-methyltransferase 1
MKAIELFSGAGGLGMGISLAGFEPIAVVEWDRWACDTIRENQTRGYPLVRDWPLFEGDVRDWIRSFNPRSVAGEIDLVAGGPPCQPFSMGGKHKAHNDSRDMFPSAVEVVRKCKPRAFIIENVKGLTRSSFANYYQYILLQLEFPEIVRKVDESWREHYARLQTVKTSTGRGVGTKGLRYNVVPTLVNAANYGIPQRRERVFIVGFRSDLNVQWSFPSETHSLDALLTEQWVTGDYWERHGISSRRRPSLSPALAQKVERLRGLGLPPTRLPWRTVRDALLDLPEPSGSGEHRVFANHRIQDGARAYPGHTGSLLDMPAKTLKAGDHGVPGGENMMVRDNGTLRYFSVRESARLQTFPDGFVLRGSWTEAMRQLGNAVPVALAHLVAASVAEKLVDASVSREAMAKSSVVAR